MPKKMSPSKRPLPVGKRSSLRNRSYEVEPVSGRKVYPSRDFVAPVRPPPLTDEEVSALQSSNQVSRSVSRYDPAQSLFEVAPDISGGESFEVSNPSQSPPEIARHQSLDSQLPSQLTTSRRSDGCWISAERWRRKALMSSAVNRSVVAPEFTSFRASAMVSSD